MHSKRFSLGLATLILAASAPMAVVTSASTPAAASPAPITIAYITSVTGPGASEDSSSPGVFKARLEEQNAKGGVNGHKLVPLVIDDQTSPSEVATAVQEADSKAFAIVSQSPLFFLAAKYPQQQGIPVTGSYSDGPEWGTKPYTNMFAADDGSVDPKYPVNTLAGQFLKERGRDQARHLRLRHLPLVEPSRHSDGGLLQARGRHGARPQHHGAVRRRGLHQ